jgi:probable HAF family extracellular repeat protein
MRDSVKWFLGTLVLLIFSNIGCGGGNGTVPRPSSPPPAAPSASITVTPTSVVAGQAVVLAWQSANPTDASIAGIGEVALSGSESLTPTDTTTYTLTATGAGGTLHATAQVTVTQPPPPPPPPPPGVSAHYTLTILPPVDGGMAAQAEAINASGTVAGYSIVNGKAEATLWQDGTTIDLGEGWAVAINDPGTAAGYVNDGFPQATTWPGGSLGTLPGYDSSIANAIDSDGTVVGVCFEFSNPSHQQGFMWTAVGGMQAIPQLQSALAISNGKMAGIGLNFDAAIQGTDLGIQGAASAINPHGDAAGFTSGQVQAFVWQGGSVTDLGTGGTDLSIASGINHNGIVVGQIGNAVSGSVRLARRVVLSSHGSFVGTTRAMAWTAADGIVDLNGRIAVGSGWTLAFASGINGSGEIVGAAISDGQVTEGFVLVPLEPQP